MKRFGVVLFALILGGAGGYFAWRYLAGQTFASSVDGDQRRIVTAANYKEPFMWGVNANPSAIGNYSIDTWTQQMTYVNQLGTPWIRLSFDNTPSNKFQIFDEMINQANKQGIKVYLGLGSTKPVTSIDDTYQDGFKVGSEVATHYKGKVKYYQLMSEQGSTALKGGQYTGENESDYNPTKYAKVRDWMKGASDAIRKADPNAYLVITDQWTHTAYFDMLIRDKVQFDIIGWNWFGDMGMMNTRKLKNGTLLIDKLKSFNKPLILAEVNYRPGATGMDEEKQSEFIQKMADWAANSGVIKGFFVHELVDIAPRGNKADYYGLMYYKERAGGGFTFGKVKRAFLTYHNLLLLYLK